MPPCHGGGRGFESRPVRKGSEKSEPLLFMPFYVYIIQSQLDNSYYKGFTEDPPLRVTRHNNGESQYTSARIPWKLVYVEELETKTLALKREKRLKSYAHDQIINLINSTKNIAKRFR